MNLKIINRIAKTELASLFYSPVAWILLVVFAVQIGADFMDVLREIIKIKVIGRQITFSVTAGVVLGTWGIYEVIQDSIYLYIPLLTMNLMSREYASGSDKLLYSSPVSSVEIILGKFVATLVCSLIFVAILALPAVTVAITVPQADFTLILAGLLSMFLLIMTYCSIGLFMSSLTSYQVVAAVATLSALAVFNFIGTIGQQSPVFREITYWLSIKGRASEMVGGLVCSEDVIYFIAVSAFFLALAVIRLDNLKIRRSASAKALRYLAVSAALVLVGFVSSRPALKTFADLTHNKVRTLSEESQTVMKQLDGPLTITSYADVQDPDFKTFIPAEQMKDRDRFKMYTRFKPEIRMKYVYYYTPITDTSVLNSHPGMTEEQIAREIAELKGYKHPRLVTAASLADEVDLESENYRFVRVIRRGNGRESKLRIYDDMFMHPKETEISAAMKKLVVEPVKIAILAGHGERSIVRKGDRDFSIFSTGIRLRNSMINQGFDLVEVNLSRDSIPGDAKILFIPDPLVPLSVEELASIDSFVEKGGNLMILTDAGHQANVSALLSRFGVKAGPDVDPEGQVYGRATKAAADSLKGFYRTMQRARNVSAVIMPGAASLEIADTGSFKAFPILETDTLSTSGPKTLALALTRDRGTEKRQRILILSDADCFSNSFLQLSGQQKQSSYNGSMLPNSFRWLCYGEFPVSSSHAPNRDTAISLTPSDMSLINNIYCIYIPALIIALAAFVIIRRRKR